MATTQTEHTTSRQVDEIKREFAKWSAEQDVRSKQGRTRALDALKVYQLAHTHGLRYETVEEVLTV